MAIAEKLQNIMNEKTSQATMTNYGLSSEEQINSNTKFIDYPKYIFKAFIESLNNPNTLWGNLPKVNGEGKEITLNNTIEAPMKLELKPSELEQATTNGNNVLPQNIETQTLNGVTLTANSDGTYTLNGTASANTNFVFPYSKYINFSAGTYMVSCNTFTNVTLAGYYGSGTIAFWKTSNGTFTLNENVTGFRLQITIPNGSSFNNVVIKPMINTGSTAKEWEPYTGGIASPSPSYPQQIHTISGDNEIVVRNSDNTLSQVKEINLGNLEYCEIGDYKDEFYLSTSNDTGLVSGKWYIKKNIGKVVLDGSENWDLDSPNSRFFSNTTITDYDVPNRFSALCSHYKYNGTPYFALSGSGNFLFLGYPNSSTNTVALFKTWLGTNKPILYYVLSTPTYTLLNDTLQTQLEDIYNTLKSYNGQTNISQVNTDLAFNISSSAIEDIIG